MPLVLDALRPRQRGPLGPRRIRVRLPGRVGRLGENPRHAEDSALRPATWARPPGRTPDNRTGRTRGPTGNWEPTRPGGGAQVTPDAEEEPPGVSEGTQKGSHPQRSPAHTNKTGRPAGGQATGEATQDRSGPPPKQDSLLLGQLERLGGPR